MNTQQPRQRQSVAFLPVTEPTNRRLPSHLKEKVPLAAQYEQLQQAEARLDATFTRKKFDMQDALNRPLKVKRTMRIWCSNTVNDQAWQITSTGMEENNFDFENDNVPSWTLRIVGQVLPDETLDDPSIPLPKFTDLVRSVVIEEDKGINTGLFGPEAPLLEYQKPPPGSGPIPPSLPGIQINRQGDCDAALIISLTLENSPERYKLPEILAELLDMPTATRQEIMAGIWEYVQAEKLQDSEEKRLIHADAALANIFSGQERLFFPDLPKLVDRLLLPLDPIVMRYNVKTDQARTVSPICWDVEVVLDSPIRESYYSALGKLNNHDAEIETLDRKIADLVLQVEQSLSKKDFLESYAMSPGEFIKQWLDSQNYDMEVMMGDVTKVSGENARRADFYAGKQDWLRESLFHYLSEPRPV